MLCDHVTITVSSLVTVLQLVHSTSSVNWTVRNELFLAPPGRLHATSLPVAGICSLFQFGCSLIRCHRERDQTLVLTQQRQDLIGITTNLNHGGVLTASTRRDWEPTGKRVFALHTSMPSLETRNLG